MKSKIRVEQIILGTHNWPGASGVVEFLKHEHHHNFHITVECEVSHDDREVEFIMLRNFIMDIFYGENSELDRDGWIVKFGAMSCEMIAQKIKNHLREVVNDRSWKVYVSEDGVQGGGQW